jgi:sterol desaturase/sphingolipid hydroxylase (fatty acid hydroxylase superfamily)
MLPSFDPVTLAVPLFILTIVLEIVLARFGKVKAVYEPKDTAMSLLMGLGSSVAGLLTGGLILAVTIWVYQYRVFTIPMTAWWAWVLLLFAEDLAYYGFHRFSHERRLWWAAHVNHHSSQHYNLATALRQSWTGGINGAWVMWLPLSLLGFPPAMILIQKGISLVYQFWIHTEAVKRMPAWFEAVFNTPSHHRVHHARNPRYLDRNYAGILIIWDKMFGTFQTELDAEPVRYGIVKNLGGFNLLRVAFHEWVGMGKDLLTAKSVREAAGYVFGAPGWSPDGSRQTSDMIRRQWQQTQTAEPAKTDPAAV